MCIIQVRHLQTIIIDVAIIGDGYVYVSFIKKRNEEEKKERLLTERVRQNKAV